MKSFLKFTAGLSFLFSLSAMAQTSLKISDAILTPAARFTDASKSEIEFAGQESGSASFQFTIAASGQYSVSAHVLARLGNANSLYIAVDSAAKKAWHFAVSENYSDQKVDLGALSVGSHTITLFGREKGVRIDGLSLLDKGGGEVVLPKTVTFEKTYLEKANLSGMTVVQAKTMAEAVALVKSAAANTKVVLPAGNFVNQDLVFEGKGEVGFPVVIEGSASGTVFSQKVNLLIKGQHVLLNRLTLQNYDSKKYGGSGGNFIFDLCSWCGLYNSTAQDSVAAVMSGDSDTKHFKTVLITAKSQSVEIANNVFKNKQNAGSVVLINRIANRAAIYEGHRIYKNKFLDRKLEVNDANDFDSIRVGDSVSSQSPSPVDAAQSLNDGIIVGNVIEDNLFQDTRIKDPEFATCSKDKTWTRSSCKGEPEVISVKAPQTIVRFNTFRNNSGGLTIRHGFQDVVEGNYFYGPMQNSYGIRIIGDTHVVMNNYFEGLNASSALLGGISILPGQPNAENSGYWPVYDSVVAMNYLKDVGTKPVVFSSDYGNRDKTISPERVVFAYNAIKATVPALRSLAPDEQSLTTFTFIQNIFDAPSLGILTPAATARAIASDDSVNGQMTVTAAKKKEFVDAIRAMSGASASLKIQSLMKFLKLNNQTLQQGHAAQ